VGWVVTTSEMVVAFVSEIVEGGKNRWLYFE
jgi:hypothetical protein